MDRWKNRRMYAWPVRLACLYLLHTTLTSITTKTTLKLQLLLLFRFFCLCVAESTMHCGLNWQRGELSCAELCILCHLLLLLFYSLLLLNCKVPTAGHPMGDRGSAGSRFYAHPIFKPQHCHCSRLLLLLVCVCQLRTTIVQQFRKHCWGAHLLRQHTK